MDYSKPGGGLFYNLLNPGSSAPSFATPPVYPDPRASAYLKMPQGSGAQSYNIPDYPYSHPGAPPVQRAPGQGMFPYATPGAPPVQGANPSIPPAYGQPQAAVGPMAANPALATTNTSPGTYGPASQAFHQATGAGGLTGPSASQAPPLPPVRPADLGNNRPTFVQHGNGNFDSFPDQSQSMQDKFGTSSASAASPPSGSNLAQGAGHPGSGLSDFLGNIFGNQAGQGNVLGNTGGTSPKNIFSGDPQSSLPSFMKGSAISNLLQMLGIGGF